MRRIIVSQFVTVDGVMEGPGNDPAFDRAGWAFKFDRGSEGNAFKLNEVMEAGALLLGRVTYDGFAAAWPNMTDEVGFAEKMNGMPKYVVSTTLNAPSWTNTTILSGDVVATISRLKKEQGGDLLVNGSGQLVRALAANDLVDEYRLMVFPIIVGTGKPMFGSDFQPSALTLVESRPVGPDGVLVLTYRPNTTEQLQRPTAAKETP
ncbi:dihydrofolate reductase family protein [Hamadaea tsunoensis]|uniref:dihydrofolate reductase family protein n=1 Tax=Hamadaea tsunoensis TaxID=53368 RepID=UPI000685EC87|nr:dihydrofolate reductase family protein [Hamadaea tsunoensis]